MSKQPKLRYQFRRKTWLTMALVGLFASAPFAVVGILAALPHEEKHHFD
jgi:hypothetical protein